MDLGSALAGTGVGTIAVGIINFVVNRRKLGADTASVLTAAAVELVEPLRAQIKELRAEVVHLKQQVATAVAELDACHDLNRHKDDLIAAFTREQPNN